MTRLERLIDRGDELVIPGPISAVQSSASFRLPSPLWPRSTFDAVVDAVADALIADVRARRRKDGAA